MKQKETVDQQGLNCVEQGQHLFSSWIRTESGMYAKQFHFFNVTLGFTSLNQFINPFHV